MAKKQFKAESKRLLDLMINSIYTHKEIFLRELISNASDAVDKLAYKALTDDQVGLNRSDFKITLTPDQDARTLTISDNGIGMTKEELEQNLGTIARSGSLQFKQELAQGRTAGRTPPTSSASSAWASTPPSWWPTRSPSPPGPTAPTRRGSGTPPARTATPSPPAGRRALAPTSCSTSSTTPRTTTTTTSTWSSTAWPSWSKNTPTTSTTPSSCVMHKSRQKPRPEDAGEDYKPEWEDLTSGRPSTPWCPCGSGPKSEVTAEEYNQFYKEKYGDWEDP